MKRILMARLVQKVQHGLPGIYLLQEGVEWLSQGAGGWHLALAVTEIVTAGAVIALLLKEVWHVRRAITQVTAGQMPHIHFGVDAIDLWLGLMCFTEVWAHWEASGHIRRPTVLLGVVMIGLGLWGGKLYRRKLMRRGLIA